MDCYIWHILFLVTILLFIIAIICYYNANIDLKGKKYNCTNNIKWKVMNFKKSVLKIGHIFILMT